MEAYVRLDNTVCVVLAEEQPVTEQLGAVLLLRCVQEGLNVYGWCDGKEAQRQEGVCDETLWVPARKSRNELAAPKRPMR